MAYYNKQEYDDVIDKITLLVDEYEKAPKNNYTLFLASGDTIKYSINDFNVPHLLGIDFSKFISHNIMEKDNYYKLLKKLIDDPYKYWTALKSNGLSLNDLFSQHINEKLDNFSLQIKVPYPNQVYFICKYDRTRNYQVKEIDGLYSDYFVVRKNDNGDLVLLGLVKDQNGNYYLPQTSRIIKNDDDLIDNIDEVIDNQVITYLNGLTIDNPYANYNRTYNLSILEITDTLDKLINISNLSNAIPNTLHDHLYNLKTFNKNRNVSYDGKNLLYRIREEILAKRIVNLTMDEKKLLDTPLISIFEAYNDLLVNNNQGDFSETYTEIKKENENLSNENDNLREQLQNEKESLLALREEISKQNETINSLTAEKEEYEELKVKVLTLASSIKQ